LDRAIFRRFDAVIEYPLPTPEVAEEVIRTRLANVDLVDIRWPEVRSAAGGLSHAELTLASERAAKDAILRKKSGVSTSGLVDALRERRVRSTT